MRDLDLPRGADGFSAGYCDRLLSSVTAAVEYGYEPVPVKVRIYWDPAGSRLDYCAWDSFALETLVFAALLAVPDL